MKNISHSLLFWLFLIPVIYVCYLWAYAVNIPWMDDIDAFVDSFLLISDATSLPDALAELIAPNNEHRMIPSKVVNYLTTISIGHLNFKLLIFLHNGLLLFLIYQFFTLRNSLPKIQPIYWLLFLLFLLTPQYHLTTNWSITGWQTMTVLLFGFLTLKYLPSNQKNHLIYALILGFITTNSYGNGPLIWFIGLIILLLQKRWKTSIIWSISAILAISLYFFRHTTGRNSEAFAYFKTHIGESIQFFFVFIGSNGDWFKHLPEHQRSLFPFIWGIFLVALFGIGCFFFSKKYLLKKENIASAEWTLWGFLLLLFANAVLVASLRANLGFEVMVVSNYRVYSAFMLATLTLWLNSLLPLSTRKTTRYVLLIVAIIFYFASWNLSIPELRTRKQFLQAHAYNQQFNGVGLGALNDSPFYSYLQEKIGEVVKRGVYTYPSYFPTDLQKQFSSAQPSPAISWNENDRRVSTDVPNADACYFIFYSDKQLYLIPAKQIYQPRYTFFTTSTQTYQAELLPTFFTKNTYQLGLLIEKDGQHTVLASHQKVRIGF